MPQPSWAPRGLCSGKGRGPAWLKGRVSGKPLSGSRVEGRPERVEHRGQGALGEGRVGKGGGRRGLSTASGEELSFELGLRIPSGVRAGGPGVGSWA